MRERAATILIILLLVLVPAAVFFYGHNQRPAWSASGIRTLDLTGVASGGVWTLDSVSSINYWWKQYTPATIHLELGETVLLRLRSADVYHQFYVPALNLGPIPVKPGVVEAVELRATRPGAFQYYCTYMCGNCHFYMRGWIIVTPHGEKPVEPDPLSCPACLPDYGPRPSGDRIALGSYLYLSMGCGTCHGVEGQGGIENYNYINGEIPAHNNTVEKFFLNAQEDADILLSVIRNGSVVDETSEASEISNFAIVKARFVAAKDLIRQGKNAAPLDLKGPSPPLQMPAWRYKLTDQEIDAVIGYFLSLYDWDAAE